MLKKLKNEWVDLPEYHREIHETFSQYVTDTPLLDAHRTYVETKVFGMGERSFWWVWKLICESLPENPKLLELGVFKAATLSLWKLLREDAQAYGATPLDGRGTGWMEDDYLQHIQTIHNDFELEMPELFVGSSSEKEIIDTCFEQSPYHVIYVDGDHSHSGALSDLVNYSPMVKQGGYLVIDDAACRTKQFFGFFQGIDTVCRALEEWEKTEIAKEFEFQFNVVHLMIYKRK